MKLTLFVASFALEQLVRSQVDAQAEAELTVNLEGHEMQVMEDFDNLCVCDFTFEGSPRYYHHTVQVRALIKRQYRGCKSDPSPTVPNVECESCKSLPGYRPHFGCMIKRKLR